jgi:hypothetical protein
MHADGDQAVTTGGHAVEALAQEHGIVGLGHDLEVARRRVVDAEQPRVSRDPLAGGRGLVGREAGREVAVPRRHRVRRPEPVPRHPQSGG